MTSRWPRYSRLLSAVLLGGVLATSATVPAAAGPSGARAEVGERWKPAKIGKHFEGVRVTDVVSGPKGFVAVGWTLDDPAEPRAWFSKNGIRWRPAKGNLGLPKGFSPGHPESGMPLQPPWGWPATPQFVVGHDGKRYVFLVRSADAATPAAQQCAPRARMAYSSNGKRWKAAGAVDVGVGDVCPLPDTNIPAHGELSVLLSTDDRIVVGGILCWWRAFSTNTASAGIWSGRNSLSLVSTDSATFRPDAWAAIGDGVVHDGRVVMVGYTALPTRGLVLVSDDAGRTWKSQQPGSAHQAGESVGFLAATSEGDAGILAVGTSSADGVRIWRSDDGDDWEDEKVDDDVPFLYRLDVAAGSWGAVVAGVRLTRTGGPYEGKVLMRGSGDRWMTVPDVTFENAEGVIMEATDRGVVLFVQTDTGVEVYTSGRP